jgi:hypothetical protein
VRPTNLAEIKRIIKDLKPKKSAGADDISKYMIKRLSPAYLESLCSCFSQFIEDWKLAKIITLNKSG